MPDQKPTKRTAGERDTLLGMLQYQRESFVRKVGGIDSDAAHRRIVPSGTTLLWLTKHLATAEATWVLRRFAGGDDVVPNDAVVDGDTIAAAIDAYRAMWKRVDDVVGGADLDATCARMEDGEPQVNLRWILAHLVQETARHAGHADILRELIDGSTGR